jgi:hypothetical protein
MADGLLSGLTNWIDQRKQAAKASVGLLADNPQEWLAQTTARYLPTKEEEQQYRAVKQAGGDITQTPYYQKIFDLSQFQGSLKPIRGQSAAEKLGFNKDVYHFSKTGADIKEFVPGMQDLSPFGIGTHVGTKEAAYDRFLKTTNTGVTYPLKIKTERQFLNKEGKPFEEERLSSELYKLIEKIGDEKGVDVYKLPYQERNKMLADHMWKKYDAIPYINDVEAPGSISYIVPSQNIRSKFAKFDPTKAESKDILAGVLPLGLLAEDDKKQKKDMRK